MVVSVFVLVLINFCPFYGAKNYVKVDHFCKMAQETVRRKKSTSTDSPQITFSSEYTNFAKTNQLLMTGMRLKLRHIPWLTFRLIFSQKKIVFRKKKVRQRANIKIKISCMRLCFTLLVKIQRNIFFG
jgi:hypothetical protein